MNFEHRELVDSEAPRARQQQAMVTVFGLMVKREMTFLKEGHSASAALYDAATVKTTPRVKGDVFPDPSLFVLMPPPQWWKPDRQSGRHILDSGEVSALKAGAVRTD